MGQEAAKHPQGHLIRQSPPFDADHIPDDAWMKDKVVIITGGASGFGLGMFRRWAAAQAVVGKTLPPLEYAWCSSCETPSDGHGRSLCIETGRVELDTWMLTRVRFSNGRHQCCPGRSTRKGC